jgi:hypothetical protein
VADTVDYNLYEWPALNRLDDLDRSRIRDEGACRANSS